MGSGGKTTCLYAYHVAQSARMAVFAGYMMPLNYANGALKEHLTCREGAAVFDVSHMAQLDIVHPSGSAAPILAALETLIPANLIDLPEHQQRYGLLLNEHGGIIDDLMVIHAGDYVRLVVNAGCAEKDLTWLLARLPDLGITRRQRALIAVQGPMAAEAVGRLVQLPKNMRFMQVAVSQFSGHQIELSRSGYTGEDGFEVSLPEEVAEDFAISLCKIEGVQMAGLVARDSLRLEAGLCLYGQDMDEEVSAVAASLNWAIPKIRRRGGARAGGFVGADKTLDELENGARFCRIGVLAEKGIPPRSGAPVFDAETDGNQVGFVTSGAPAPSVGQPVAMLRIARDVAESSTALFAEVRGKRLALTRTQMPFFPHRFYRGS
ncbi:MAG: glycine cleavage system aminomethyltransferase GcvT [Candidatus Puniceispirillaceae bacterium]